MTQQRLNLMFSAGEASSDMHAAEAVAELRKRGVEFDCFGMGADKLKAAGMELTLDCRELSVIGIVDVLLNYHKFLRRLKKLREAMAAQRPDLLVLVDYPDFNLKLAETAKELGIPVLFYISPQIWAWRKKRIHRIGSLVSHMAVLFPFEVDIYEKASIPVTHVGHPMVDDAKSEFTQSEARAQLGLTTDEKLLALLPGSRNSELKLNLPVMLETAELLNQTYPTMQFVLPIAPTLEREQVDEFLDKSPVNISTVNGQSYDVMRAADVVLSASGTATLETAMLGTPMAVMYVINPINAFIMRRLIQIDDIGLVNIVAGKRICKEFIQENAQPAAIAKELDTCLHNAEYRQTMEAEFEIVRKKMGTGGASAKVADVILSLVT